MTVKCQSGDNCAKVHQRIINQVECGSLGRHGNLCNGWSAGVWVFSKSFVNLMLLQKLKFCWQIV